MILIFSDNADAVHATPKFVKNTSKYWYMPNITREEGLYIMMHCGNKGPDALWEIFILLPYQTVTMIS